MLRHADYTLLRKLRRFRYAAAEYERDDIAVIYILANYIQSAAVGSLAYARRPSHCIAMLMVRCHIFLRHADCHHQSAYAAAESRHTATAATCCYRH